MWLHSVFIFKIIICDESLILTLFKGFQKLKKKRTRKISFERIPPSLTMNPTHLNCKQFNVIFRYHLSPFFTYGQFFYNTECAMRRCQNLKFSATAKKTCCMKKLPSLKIEGMDESFAEIRIRTNFKMWKWLVHRWKNWADYVMFIFWPTSKLKELFK